MSTKVVGRFHIGSVCMKEFYYSVNVLSYNGHIFKPVDNVVLFLNQLHAVELHHRNNEK